MVITWADNAPKNTWLEVAIPADSNTGLPAADIFYFGNAPGEVTSALDAGLPTLPLVNAADVIAIRDNPRGAANPASIDDPHDVNRDRSVDALDLVLARNNATSPLSTLQLITPPASPAAAPPTVAGEGQMFRAAGEGESRAVVRSAASSDIASLDGLMAAQQADQPTVDAMMPSQMLGKLHRRFGVAVR